NLLIGNQQQCYWPQYLARIPLQNRFEHVQGKRNTCFNVEHARPMKPALGHTARHLRNRANGVHRVQMPEQQYRLLLSSSSGLEIDLQMVAELLCVMQVYAPAKFRKPGTDDRAQPVNC